MLVPAPHESARFGLRVFRATASLVDAQELSDELAAKRVDLAIIRIPTGTPAGMNALAARGLPAIHADTLVGYECRLSEYSPNPVSNHHLPVEPARLQDRDEILALVRTVFDRYPSHYRANPLLPTDATVEGYGEWALGHLDDGDKVAWVVRANGRIAALACSAQDGAGTCHGVLHGVHPDFGGSGIYTDLIRHTQLYFRKLGCHTMNIKTQVGNLPVQRVWVREGFTFTEALDTLHVNALLDTGRDGTTGIAPLPHEDITTRFLVAASDLALRSDPTARVTMPDSRSVTVWSQPNPAGNCEIRMRTYATLSGHDIVSATLHDIDARLCAIARFDVRLRHVATAHNGTHPT